MPVNAEELSFTKKNTVVTDVLRATTTIVTALQNGAKEIIPVNSVEFAMQFSGNSFKGHTLLGGERNALKIEGFALGNSPIEYTEEIVKGKSIVLFTTNGSKAILKAKFSQNLFILSFLNMDSVADKIINLNEDIEILCSGNYGKFSFEDSACAGMLISLLMEKKDNIVMNDGSRVCKLIYDQNKNKLEKMLKSTEHGEKLIASGFIKDIEFAAKESIYNIVPYYNSGVIKIN